MKSVQSPQLSIGSTKQPATSYRLDHSVGVWERIVGNPVAALLCLILFSFTVRLYLLTNQSFWFDEGATLAMTASGSLAQTYHTLMSAAGADKYQPLYFFLLTIWRTVFGDGEFALRLFSVIPGALLPVIMYFASKRLFGRRHALLTTVFIASSAFSIAYSQELRPYSLLILLAALQLLALGPVLTQSARAPSNRLLLAIVTTIACFGSVLLIVFTVALAASHLLAFRQWRVWLKTWAPVCLGLPLLALYYGTAPTINNVTVDAINGTGMPIWKNLVFSQYAHLAGQTFGPSLETLRLLDSITSVVAHYPIELIMLVLSSIILLVCGALNLTRKEKDKNSSNTARFIIYLYGFSLCGAFAVALFTQINWMPRHSFYLLIPLGAGVPLALNSLPAGVCSKPKRIQTIMASGAFTALITINVFAASNYFHKPDHWRDDYRAASVYLHENLDSNDQTFMLWGEPYLVSYYGHGEITNLWPLEDEHLILSRIIDADASGEGRVFLFINREYSWASHSPELLALLNLSFEMVPTAQFNNVNIYEVRDKQLIHADEDTSASKPPVHVQDTVHSIFAKPSG